MVIGNPNEVTLGLSNGIKRTNTLSIPKITMEKVGFLYPCTWGLKGCVRALGWDYDKPTQIGTKWC
jgi:hypothetical protein